MLTSVWMVPSSNKAGAIRENLPYWHSDAHCTHTHNPAGTRAPLSSNACGGRERSKRRQAEDVCKGQKERKGRCMNVRKGGQVGEGGGDGWWREKLRLKSEWRERKGKERSWKNTLIYTMQRDEEERTCGTVSTVQAKYSTVEWYYYKGQYLWNKKKVWNTDKIWKQRKRHVCKNDHLVLLKRRMPKNIKLKV